MTIANLDELRKVKDPAERARAARDYITAREAAITEARKIRAGAIADLLKDHGVTEVARLCDVSVSTVKLVRERS